MLLFHRISSLLRNLFRHGSVERDLNDEIGSYLETLIERKITQGIDTEEARRLSLIELGGAEQVKERVRGMKMGRYLETLLQDLRYGVRMLIRHPAFTAVSADYCIRHRREYRDFQSR